MGDILIQQVERATTKKAPKPFSIRRVIVFALVAGFYIAPVIACWFDWLSAAPFLSGMAAEKKAFFMMLLDQTFGAVIINFFFYFAFELVSCKYKFDQQFYIDCGPAVRPLNRLRK